MIEIADFSDYTVSEALEIIDEALIYGFTFKVENYQILFTDSGNIDWRINQLSGLTTNIPLFIKVTGL